MKAMLSYIEWAWLSLLTLNPLLPTAASLPDGQA